MKPPGARVRRAVAAGLAGALALAAAARAASPVRALAGATARGPMPRPDYLDPVTDPATGLELVRITDAKVFGGTARARKHAYAKREPWNADGSLLLLSGWPQPVLDGRSLRLLRHWHGPSQSIWSNRDPHVVYGVRHDAGAPPAFVRADPREDWSFERTTLRAFPEYDSIDLGGGEGNLSDDDRYVALFGRTAGGTELLVYDIPNDSVVARRFFAGLSAGASRDIDNATMSPSGRWVIAQFGVPHDGRPPATEQLDRGLDYVRRISPRDGSHGDVGIDAAGDEVWVMPVDPASNALHSTRLSDGRIRVELPASRIGNPIHVSCRNLRRPGWCYVSGFARVGGHDADDARSIAWRSVIALRLDGSGHAERVADTRHAAGIVEGEYERAPMAVPDREGVRVLWASDWGDATPGAPIETYVSGPSGALPPRRDR